jgi:hypothetical protein
MAEEKKSAYDLDKIVADLDPEKINKEVELKHRETRNKYKLENTQIKDYNKFFKEVTEYLKHHHKGVFKADLPDHMAGGRARHLLDELYKKQGGIIGAVKEAKSGNMARVLDNLAAAMESEERSNYVQHVMNRIDPQDFDGHIGLVKQYKSKFGQFMPKGMKTKSDEQLAHDYESLIDHHVKVVEEAKSALKKYEPEAKKKAA